MQMYTLLETYYVNLKRFRENHLSINARHVETLRKFRYIRYQKSIRNLLHFLLPLSFPKHHIIIYANLLVCVNVRRATTYNKYLQLRKLVFIFGALCINLVLVSNTNCIRDDKFLFRLRASSKYVRV